jgi:lysozyme family protein
VAFLLGKSMAKLTPAVASDYESKYASCVVDHDKAKVTAVAKRVLAVKGQCSGYFAVPWWFIALLWLRECNLNQNGVLHNGELLIGTGRKTKLVPAGRGPFATWAAATRDALVLKGLDKVTDWSIPATLFRIEGFNGYGYRNRGVPSPYLWSHTNHYADGSWDDDPKGGKYVADGVYDPNVYDKQIGVCAIMKCLEEMGERLFDGPASPAPIPPPDIPAPEPVNQPPSGGFFHVLLSILDALFKRSQK